MTTGRSKKQTTAIVAAAVIALFLAGVAGWAVHAATHPDHAVTVSRTFTGKISLINEGQPAGCVKPDGGGRQVCAPFAIVGSAGDATVGETVRVAHEFTHTSGHGGTGYDLLLLYPKTAP